MSTVNTATNQYSYECPDYQGHKYECLSSEAGILNISRISKDLLAMRDRLRKSKKRCEINDQLIRSYEKRVEAAEELVKSMMRRNDEIEKQYANDFEERLKEERIKILEEIRKGLGERDEMNELLQSSSSTSSRALLSGKRRIKEAKESQSKKPRATNSSS
jgi:hypothetical protein